MDYPIQQEEGSSPSHISFGFKDIPKLSMDTHQDISNAEKLQYYVLKIFLEKFPETRASFV